MRGVYKRTSEKQGLIENYAAKCVYCHNPIYYDYKNQKNEDQQDWMVRLGEVQNYIKGKGARLVHIHCYCLKKYYS